jgi:HemY protein
MRANPTERVCLLMAEIEEGEHSDQGRVRGWLARALDAPRDPVWSADGHAFPDWAPVSPISGRVDAFEWRVAADRPPGRVPVEIQSGSGATPDRSREITPAIAPATVDARSPRASVGPPATMAPSVVVAAGAAKGVRPMARAPDDPGPLVPGEDNEVIDLPIFHPGRTA